MPATVDRGPIHLIISFCILEFICYLAVIIGEQYLFSLWSFKGRHIPAGSKLIACRGIATSLILFNNPQDETARAAMRERVAKIAISPEDIANAVAYAIDQPDNVELGDIVIRPSVQD